MCIITLDNDLLKETTVEELLTKLPEVFVFVTSFPRVLQVLGGSTYIPCNQESIYHKMIPAQG
jgi:hypothetical protein